MSSIKNEGDFGYGDIPWEETTDENVAAVESEYFSRLAAASSAWADIDQKARFALSGLIAITAALTGWAFSHAIGMDLSFIVGLLTLTSLFAVAALAAAFSLLPQTYGASAGVTPDDLNVAHWKPLLVGGQPELLRLRGVRIKEYAKGIAICEDANRKKARFLKLSIVISAVAFPASAITTFVAAVALLYPTHPAVAAPIYLGLFAALVFGSFLWWGRRWVVSR